MFLRASLKGYLQNKKIRVIIDKNEEFWLNAKDVVTSLEYKKLKDTIQKLVDPDDKLQLRYINHNFNVKGIQPQ